MPAWASCGQMMAIRTKSAAIAALWEVGIFMAKIGPYPRARRASRLWYSTVIFALCSGRQGKRPLGTGELYRTAPFAVSIVSERYQVDLLRAMRASFLSWTLT